MAVLPTGIGPVTGYNIERSLRFNSADTAYLSRTPAGAGNLQTWTWSGWVKRSALGADQHLFGLFDYLASPTTNQQHGIRFKAADTLEFWCYQNPSYNGQKITTQVFRDVSAWYHIVAVWDTPNATAANRMRLYVNGSEVTTFGTNTNPTQNSNGEINRAFLHTIGTFYDPDYGSPISSLNGYLTEVNFIGGQALTPSSFGETDSATGVWKPKAYSGTYGTNGFFLKFADNSGTTSTTLGKDSSGNGNNWTPNNFSVTAGSGNDSLVDTPTNYGTDTGAGGTVRGNYCTLNQNDKSTSTITDGNLRYQASSLAYSTTRATIALPSTGKWYWENTITTVNAATTENGSVGMCLSTASLTAGYNTTGFFVYQNRGDFASSFNNDGSLIYNNSGISWTTGDIIQVAIDMATGKVWFGKNNSWWNSSGGTTGNPGAGTNETITISAANLARTIVPMVQNYGTTGVTTLNFGQRAFAYTAPSGFKALCTQNLPTPTIGATSTTQAGKYFNPVLYTGNKSTLNVTGVGFQPDFVWIKIRSGAANHALFDAVRGVGYNVRSNTTDAEAIPSPNDSLTAFNSNGFTLGANNNAGAPDINFTLNGTYVAWNWKANGAGSTNTAGTITSTVSANTTSGFSIVTYTGTGANATVGHGLGVAPSMVIVKRRNSTGDWCVWNKSVTDTSGAGAVLFLNDTGGASTQTTNFNSTAPTSTVFTVGTNPAVNASGGTHVAYCFAPVAGYSAFGSYTGNGSADGPFIYTGFKPAFILIKKTSATDNWYLLDNKRAGYNPATYLLYGNLSNAEYTGLLVDLLSNGFKPRDTDGGSNASGATYIYMALAENPFKYSLAR